MSSADTTSADTIIAALRTGHDGLVTLVAGFGDADLTRPSAASEWDISQVLSHLGSGAEIMRGTFREALGGPDPDRESNEAIWDRWNARSPRERADSFVESNRILVELLESLDAGRREELRVDLGFLPAPVDVATAGRMRLSEFALHAWDVRAALDPAATLAPEAVPPLLHDTALLGWISKPEALDGAHSTVEVTTTAPAEVFTLRLEEPVGVEFEAPEKSQGALALPAEAWLRLVAGRLSPEHTPAEATATGTADLDVLRRVFPGY
ncbi:maleylpyruvate isomerase family mycothiol-dependent enzyme [Actinocorallia longicatena]|uniref:Maleylpyruvate isomerase family mycothiol-dependent enzyme n=1 Tax=Actinocorallia longicatena TaxID=111803 RepID=A0ABP6QBG2_9ACTN